MERDEAISKTDILNFDDGDGACMSAYPVSEERFAEIVDRKSELERENVALRQRIERLQGRIKDLEGLVGKRQAPVNYAVIRFPDNYPMSARPRGLDGTWMELSSVESWYIRSNGPTSAVARATGFYECNERGQVAEVYLITIEPKDISLLGRI